MYGVAGEVCYVVAQQHKLLIDKNMLSREGANGGRRGEVSLANTIESRKEDMPRRGEQGEPKGDDHASRMVT